MTGRRATTIPEIVRTESVPGRTAFRFASVVTLAWCVGYLAWRIAAHTIPRGAPWLGGMFLAGEVALFVNLLMLVLVCWRSVHRVPTLLRSLDPPVPPSQFPRVDVFIPCVNEPLEMIRRTAAAALAIDYPADRLTVHVLDDGARLELAAWAATVQARGSRIAYIARPKPQGVPHYAKAGNLNHALFAAGTAGDLVLLLDADHVCEPGILQSLVPFFLAFVPEMGSYAFNKVGFAQAPDRSWTNQPGNYLADDTALFNGPTQQGNDGLGAVWLVSTSVLIRRAALEEIGGFYPHSVTEDVPTGFLMTARGWESRYHTEPLSRGMPPVGFAAMLRQRQRWAEGETQHTLKVLPRVWPDLPWRKRLSYLFLPVNTVTRMVFLLGGVLVPCFALLRGASFIAADPLVIAFMIAPYILLTRALRMYAARTIDPRRYFRSEQLFFCTSGVYLWAVLRVVFAPGRPYFWVTPKTRVAGQSSLVLYILSGFLPLALLGATTWTVLAQLTWPAMLTLCRLNNIVTLAWELHFLFCLSPFFSLLIVPPRLCTEYYSDTFDEKSRGIGARLRWLLMPTNVATAVTVLVALAMVVGSILARRSLCEVLP